MTIKNQLKTVMFLGILAGILLGAGYLIGGMQGLTIGLLIAVVLNFGSYWYSDKIVLFMYKAKEVDEEQVPKLYRMVKEVADLAEIPMPKVYIVPSHQPNAFATGRSPSKAAVACTQGIMNLLSDDELKGVIAHEISHIKNRDTLIQAVAATIAGVISYIAFIARWGALFGGFGGDRDNGNALELIVLAIITPILAMLIQLAISRSREYLADESAAKTINNSQSLASALEKLHEGAKHVPMRMGNPSSSSLFIVNPFTARGIMSLLSTHPSVESRVERLRAMHV